MTFQEAHDQAITKFKSAFERMIATSDAALVKTNAKELRNRNFKQRYSREEIDRIVAEGTAVERAKLSQHYFSVSGLYKRIIIHYATFLTYSWVLVPHLSKAEYKISDKKNLKIYQNGADFCANFGIERQCALFAKEVLVNGGFYGILHDTGSSVAIQNLDFAYCRSRFKNLQGVDKVEFDLKYFDNIKEESIKKQILQTFPKVIQKAYRAYQRDKEKEWVFIPDEIGIYFKLFEEKPFFLDLIPLLDDLEDYKAIDKQRNMLSLKRIITQESPHDGMNLVFEPDELADMHEGVVEMLQDNSDADVISSYNKIGLLDLSGDDSDKTEVNDAQQLIYDSAGVSKELFSASSEKGIDLSLANDLAMMMILGKSFAHFFTALINNKFGTSKVAFKLIMLPVSFYNIEDYTSKMKDFAAFGYSCLTPIIPLGIDQASLADLRHLEIDGLKLDDVLVPLQSAYTQSGKANAVTAQAAKDAAKQQTQKVEATTTEKETKTESKEKDTSADKKTKSKAEVTKEK